MSAEAAPSTQADAPEAASSPACASCKKTNHPGVTRCVFCGAELAAATIPDAPHGDAASTLRVTMGETPIPPAQPVPQGAVAPESVRRISAERSIADAAMSRRAFSGDDSDDMLGVPVADPLIGVVVAERYRIVEPLGRGGMGIVYKVEHSRIGKLLAMKLLTGELSRNRDVVRRFKQEALTASKLSSPNTVQVFDFGAAEGLTYLVMELVAGEDLARALRSLGPMPFKRLGKIVIQVCTSLAEAHNMGIVHRDVKPENVMLLRAPDGTDVAKVLDFGLAKLREGEGLNDVTSQGAIVGTPYFMSPEQIRGEAVDARTDIYALGALMYRALTGHYPYNGPTPMAVFTKHLTETPVPPIERAPERDIPPGVSAIVLKALAKNPDERFQKVEDLQAALVEEVRALGTSSIENLLDSGQLRKLAKVAGEAEAKEAVAAELATRGEVERYERKLRRMYWGSRFGGLVLLGGLVAGGVKLFYHERAELHRGREVEPNDTVALATKLPFGTTISGYLGRRTDPTHGDRDFYAVDVPATNPGKSSTVKVTVSPLPNFAMCTLLYRQGFDTPLGQYCVGRPGRELAIGALELEPGRYYLAVLQDMDGYGGPPPFVYENVSDAYSVTVAATSSGEGQEVEANDQIASANPIVPGVPVTGTLGWVRDVDMFCVAPGAGTIRWRVRDTVRDLGVVLEATPMAGPLEGAPVRVHVHATKQPGPNDAESPWQSAPIPPDGDTPRCLRLRATTNPWATGASLSVPSGGAEPYTVEAVAIP